MVASAIGNVIDAYDRSARLYPALICFIPIAAVAIGVHGATLGINGALVTLVTSFGGLFLLMSISRDLGKKLEPKLYTEWGGKPTTQLLRHCNTTIDSITKKRYHLFLEKHLGIEFPTVESETANPEKSDDIYQSGAQWLLGKTKEKNKFPLIFKETVNYGFRRNCLGLKPIGISVASLSMLWILATTGIFQGTNSSINLIINTSIGTKTALVVTVMMTLIWTFLITQDSVRRVAFSYADILLRACDTLPKKR